jgi:hypothetical protein
MSEESTNIDPINQINREIGGCKVRLLFALTPNAKMERRILDNLMLVYERRVQAVSSV